jgi:putative GTP pyrophosphokinase
MQGALIVSSSVVALRLSADRQAASTWLLSATPSAGRSTWHTCPMNNSELDRLGERLRIGITPDDLTALDTFRRGFRHSYDSVVDRIRTELGLQASGRPAKSTAAIVDKLRRGSMRLTQMQDIAGCRIVVPDITTQSQLVGQLETMFKVAVIDRRAKPSHGYRAIHLIVRSTDLPVEIQLRTDLQHVWAELSEKLADAYGIALKYGGGPDRIRNTLNNSSALIAEFEKILDIDGGKDERVQQLKIDIRLSMLNVAIALEQQK